jgi:hypothetical protein
MLDGPGKSALTDQQRLSRHAASQRYTRIRALMTRLLAPDLNGNSSSSAAYPSPAPSRCKRTSDSGSTVWLTVPGLPHGNSLLMARAGK